MQKKLYILFLLIAHTLLGQVFPVQVTPQLIPPYSLTISEYTNANREQLILNLLLTDISELNRAVTLRFSLTSTAGFSVESAPVIIGALPINLSGGVPLRLTNADLQPYFEFQNLAGISPDVYGRPLPDGLYQFCFEVFDALSGQQISRQSCATAFLVLNDPPFLNTPSKGEIIAEQNPQNIIFQWTPRHLNATNVEYEFTLVELWDELQDPQASFLAGMPYYQTTTRATTLLYCPGEPGLLANKNYAWRVRAMVSDGISQASIFKNDGYSEIYYFEHNGECLPPQFALTTPKTKNSQTVQWQGGNYVEYNLQYRKKDGASNEWFDVSAFNEQANILNLEESTTYEYRVGGQCRTNGGFSYGNISEFTTAESNAEAAGYECGILPDIQITNPEPLPRLGVNDVFTAGDFPVTVKAVTSSNAATGNYSGVGYITVPYLADTKIKVVFNNVKINSDYQLIDGIVETDYDADNLDNLSSVDEVLEVFEGDNDLRVVEIGFDITIEDIKVNEDGSVTVTDPEGNEERTYAAGDDITIQDESGDMFTIDKEGNIREGGEAAEGGVVDSNNTPNVDSKGNVTQLSAAGIKVTFIADSEYSYGFDEVPNGQEIHLSTHYTEIKDIDDNPYKIIHKAIANGLEDKLKAEVEITDDTVKITDLVIKTASGQNIEYTVSGNTITLDLKGYYAYENEDVYATIQPSSVNEEEIEDSDNDSAETEQEQTIAGVFKLWHLTNKVVNVTIIPAKGVSLPSESVLKEQVNQIFGKAAVTINLNIASEFEVSPSLYGNDGTLLMGESGVFENYTDEQRAVINDYKSKNNTSLENYYLFAMGSNIQPSRSGVAGFMPVSRQFGFVFTGNISNQEEGKSSLGGTIAHELGHGAFGLEHPFDEYGTSQGGTSWLLDYGNGTEFSHMDWKQIHNPAFKLYFFQDDEDGEYTENEYYEKVLQLLRCAYASGTNEILIPNKLKGVTEKYIRFSYGIPVNKSEINGEKIVSANLIIPENATKIQNILKPQIIERTGEISYGNFTLKVPIPSYNWNNGITPFQHFRNFLFPSENQVKEEFLSLWDNGIGQKINSNQTISDEDVDNLKKVASCGTKFLSPENRYRLSKAIFNKGDTEEYEDLVLDIFDTIAYGEQSDLNNFVSFLENDFSFFRKLYEDMTNTSVLYSGNEDNKNRFLNTLYILWSGSQFSDPDNSIYTYNEDSSGFLLYDGGGVITRTFKNNFTFNYTSTEKDILVKEHIDEGAMDDASYTNIYKYHFMQPVRLAFTNEKEGMLFPSHDVPVFLFNGC